MKKATMNTIVNYINAHEIAELFEVRDELVAELSKGAEKAQANRELYDVAKEVALSELGETPVTIGELYEAIADKLPEGFTKGKLQYAMTRLWGDAIGRVEGKVNTYFKA